MKQLKFMLAAATAISLATAAQAATKPLENENFNRCNTDMAGASITNETSGIPGFSFEGTEGDNESAIVEESENDKALKVNTGTDPLLRKISDEDGSIVSLASVNHIEIDTMVQFTVTPDGDDVVPTSDDDKLLIYLKEDLDAKCTNLIVRAAGAVYDSEGNATSEMVENGVEYVVTSGIEGLEEIKPNEWYRLVVKAKALPVGENAYWPVFNVYLGGDTEDYMLITDKEGGFEALNEKAAGDLTAGSDFVSLQITVENADGMAPDADAKDGLDLIYVGFAGEGMIDDFVVTKDYEATTVDFTFTWTTDGISAVKYAIGEATKYTTLGDEKTIADLDPEATIKIQIVPAEWYAVKEDADLEYTASEESASLDDLIKEVTAADLDVKNPSGASDDTVNAALAWAKNANKTPEAVEAASNIIANYLLNVTDLTDEPQIKITGIDLSGDVPTVTAEVTTSAGTTIKTLTADNINEAAAIKYKAAATLEALKDAEAKSAIEAGDQFIQVVVE